MNTDATWDDSMPEIYDRCLGAALFLPYARHLASSASSLDPMPHDVLELAAGTGLLTAELIAELPAANLVATDLNPAMVQWGSRRVPAVDWRAADATRLPFPDASFDLVACQFG